MPLVKIEILEGKTTEYKRALMDEVHEALVQILKIPEDDRQQRLYALPQAQFVCPDNKTDAFTMIELTLFPGRSSIIKRNLIEAITKRLGERLGIAPGDVCIVIHEPPLDNWGIGGKQQSMNRPKYKKV